MKRNDAVESQYHFSLQNNQNKIILFTEHRKWREKKLKWCYFLEFERDFYNLCSMLISNIGVHSLSSFIFNKKQLLLFFRCFRKLKNQTNRYEAVLSSSSRTNRNEYKQKYEKYSRFYDYYHSVGVRIRAKCKKKKKFGTFVFILIFKLCCLCFCCSWLYCSTSTSF